MIDKLLSKALDPLRNCDKKDVFAFGVGFNEWREEISKEQRKKCMDCIMGMVDFLNNCCHNIECWLLVFKIFNFFSTFREDGECLLIKEFKDL